MNLNVNEWKEFKISDLFDVKGSKTTSKKMLEDFGIGNNPYITTSAQNNGVEGHYNGWTEKGNVITVESACMGFSTYQEKDFLASDHVEILKAKFDLNKNLAMFFITLINNENYKFSYGRKCNQNKIRNMIIKLPIFRKEDGEPFIDETCKYSDAGYIPDFAWMEKYIKSLNNKPITTSISNVNNALLVSMWKDFKISDLFDVTRGSRILKNDYSVKLTEEFKYPVITAKTVNNGVDGYYNVSNCKGNCLISCGEVSGMYTTYQKEPCWVMDTARIISFKYDKEFTPYLAIFFATLFIKNMYKFSYGRKAKPSNICDLVIKLPICCKEDGEPIIDESKKYSKYGYVPDFTWMENYIKSLPYSDRI